MNRKNALRLVIIFVILSTLFLIGDMVYSSVLTCESSFWKLEECHNGKLSEESSEENMEYEPIVEALID